MKNQNMRKRFSFAIRMATGILSKISLKSLFFNQFLQWFSWKFLRDYFCFCVIPCKKISRGSCILFFSEIVYVILLRIPPEVPPGTTFSSESFLEDFHQYFWLQKLLEFLHTLSRDSFRKFSPNFSMNPSRNIASYFSL